MWKSCYRRKCHSFFYKTVQSVFECFSSKQCLCWSAVFLGRILYCSWLDDTLCLELCYQMLHWWLESHDSGSVLVPWRLQSRSLTRHCIWTLQRYPNNSNWKSSYYYIAKDKGSLGSFSQRKHKNLRNGFIDHLLNKLLLIAWSYFRIHS